MTNLQWRRYLARKNRQREAFRRIVMMLGFTIIALLFILVFL